MLKTRKYNICSGFTSKKAETISSSSYNQNTKASEILGKWTQALKILHWVWEENTIKSQVLADFIIEYHSFTQSRKDGIEIGQYIVMEHEASHEPERQQ